MNNKLLFEETVQRVSLDERVFTGRFSTHIWNERYRVDGLLGEGAQGSTLRAVDLKTQNRVAIKVIDLRTLKSLKSLELFERELKVLRELNNERLPRLIDVLDDEGVGARAIVMSLVPGISWHQKRKQGALDETRSRRLLKDVAQALAVLHSKGLVHRDIKPENLLVDAAGMTRVVDLGGVGNLQSRGSTIVGTFGFMAPEQLYGAHSSATDFYGLGATVIALCSDEEPENLPRKGLEIDVDQCVPHFSRSTRQVLKGLLKSDPEMRTQSAKELLRTLEMGLEKVDQNIALYEKKTVTTGEGPGTLMFLAAVSTAPLLTMGFEVWLLGLVPTFAGLALLLPARRVTYDRKMRCFRVGRKVFSFDDVSALCFRPSLFRPKIEFLDEDKNVLASSTMLARSQGKDLATFAALLGFPDSAALLGLHTKLKRGEALYVDDRGISVRRD